MPTNPAVLDQTTATNYMVPAAGNTHCVPIGGTFTATPYNVDWRQFKIDNFPFIPQGVFVDNSKGTGALVILIKPLGYTITVPAGIVGQYQFPAMASQNMDITGLGDATLFFVDFPVLPNAGAVQVLNTVDVNIASASNAASPVYTAPSVNSGGLPYQTAIRPEVAEYHGLSIAAGATTATVNPTVGKTLRKVILDVSDYATQAVAGEITVTLSLNGAVFYSVPVYVPTGAGQGAPYHAEIDFTVLGFTVTGAFAMAVSGALATGTVQANGYFN